MQAELAKFYENIDDLFPDDTIRHIDASVGVDEVAETIWDEVMMLRGESK